VRLGRAVRRSKAKDRAAGSMLVACSPESDSRWTCATDDSDERTEPQRRDMASEGVCDLSPAKLSCVLQNAAETLRITASSAEGAAWLMVRLDLEGDPTIGIRICSGPAQVTN